MSFQNPAFLYGLFALAIPVIIHLFHFRKVKKVYFSNTRFLQNIKKVNQSKLKLRHYLILAARMLFILFLVLAFAQPFIPAATGREQSDMVDIYIDNSYSMSNNVDEDLSGLDAAVQISNEIVGAYPEGTRFRLLTNNFETSAQYYLSGQSVTDRLTELEYSGTSRSVIEVLDRLKIMPFEGRQAERDVFMLSDFQEHNWVEDGLQAHKDSLEQLYLVPLEYAQTGNVYVDTVYLDKPLIFSSSQSTVHAVFTNAGMQAVEDMQVSLTINGMQVANSSISIPARGQEQLSFQLNFAMQPFNRCVLSFEDYPVTFDNEFFFVIREAGKVAVLEIKEEPGQTAVGRVYADSASFIFRSFQANNIDYGALNDADLLVVNGLSRLDDNLQAALLSFQRDGGSILIIPAEEGMPEGASLLANNMAIQESTLNEPVRMAPVQISNPFFEDIFEEGETTFDMPRARPVVAWSGRSENLINLQTGNPFLGQSGDTYLLASPLQESYTSFHQHALFVPVMYKIAFNSLSISNNLYQTTDKQFITLQADVLESDEVYRLRRGEQEVIPDQQIGGRSLQMELPADFAQPGFYELIANGEVIHQMAFNHSQEESRINQLSVERLEQEASGNEQISIISDIDTNQARASVEQKFRGEALWKWALLLALLSLLAEVLLIRFWK